MAAGAIFIALGGFALLIGFGIWGSASSAVHQIAGLITILIAWLLIIGGTILCMMSHLGRLLVEMRERLPKPRVAPSAATPVQPMAPEPTIPAPRQINPTAQ